MNIGLYNACTGVERIDVAFGGLKEWADDHADERVSTECDQSWSCTIVRVWKNC